MKNQTSHFLLFTLCLIMALTACSPSPYNQKNDQNETKIDIIHTQEEIAPEFEKKEVSFNDSLKKSIQEKGAQAEDYEMPKALKNGSSIMYVGYTKLKNVKSTFDRHTKILEVSGLAEIFNADQKTLRTKQEFKIRGRYNPGLGEIKLAPFGVLEEDDLQVRAVVTCLGESNCSRAIIDLILKHQNNYYTEQLESTAFENPQITGEQNKESVKIIIENNVEIKKTVIDDSKEEAHAEHVSEIEEGDDGSIAGRYEGKASTVKLSELFESKKDIKSKKDVTPEVKKNDQDRLILTNQAIGSPNNGRLRNASFLKTHIETYKLNDRIVMANSSTKNYYGTQEMMDILEALGNKVYTFNQNKIYVSRISDRDGGLLPPSKSHQNGMDTDIGYPTVQGKVGFPIVALNGSLRKSDFSAAKTLETFKYLMNQSVSPVDRLFVDQSIINALCNEAKNSGKLNGSEKETYAKLFEIMQHVDGHGNHYHLRLRCTPNQPDCQHKIYKKMNNCAG